MSAVAGTRRGIFGTPTPCARSDALPASWAFQIPLQYLQRWAFGQAEQAQAAATAAPEEPGGISAEAAEAEEQEIIAAGLGAEGARHLNTKRLSFCLFLTRRCRDRGGRCGGGGRTFAGRGSCGWVAHPFSSLRSSGATNNTTRVRHHASPSRRVVFQSLQSEVFKRRTGDTSQLA